MDMRHRTPQLDAPVWTLDCEQIVKDEGTVGKDP